jgi:hypothetical protein
MPHLEDRQMAISGELFNKYLQSAGAKIGVNLSANANGLCAFKKDSCDPECAVEMPNGSDVLYFYAPICKVPHGCEEEFFEKTLELNFCNIKYNQAALGLDRRTENIVLSYAHTASAIDEAGFANILRNFIKTVDRARSDFMDISEDLLKKSVLMDEDIDAEMCLIENGALKLRA